MRVYRPPIDQPFQLTNLVPEDDLHEAVANALDRLLAPPTRWTTFPAGHVPLPPQYAVKLARMGLKRNWPDCLILHQVLYGIELKKRGEKLSRARYVRTRSGARRYVEGQAEEFPRLEEAGMRIAVCHSLPEVMAQLEAWRIPLKGRIMA